jgi:hypothetical protein
MLAEHLAAELGASLKVLRWHGTVKGVRAFFLLWVYAFRKANGAVNITVQRMALPVIIRSVFNRSKTLVIFHHYDEREKLSIMYHFNAWLLLKLLGLGLSHVRVIVVAPYWHHYLLGRGISPDTVCLVPNLFDNEKYRQFSQVAKRKQVYFGQYGSKQHPDAYTLVNRLNDAGYTCFFTSPLEGQAIDTPAFKVLHLDFEAYCRQIAQSSYTVCFSGFSEGWNRVAHESVLLGTALIGNDAGGLGDLLRESSQLIAASADKAYNYIISGTMPVANSGFAERYHINRISYYAAPITRFCRD